VKQVRWEKRVLRPLVYLAALTPFFDLVWRAVDQSLSANPIKEITEVTGIWTLRFLVITLAVTPLRDLTGWSQIGTFRRMLGLFAFFYGFLHFTTYVALDQYFALEDIFSDVVKRPFITVGFASFLLMIPLALTSPNRVARRIGGRRWKALHRTVYAVALGGVFHYLWLVKADTSRPLLYGSILMSLLLFRIWSYFRSRRNITGQVSNGGVNEGVAKESLDAKLD
jgi:sulfoxide reductase heme-binding subunit YedZ